MLSSRFAWEPSPRRRTFQSVTASRTASVRRALSLPLGGIASQRRVRLGLDSER